MYYAVFLGFRYLLRRKVSALATLAAVLLGVATQLTVVSIFEGFVVKLQELVRGRESHLSLEGYPDLLTGVEDLQRKIEQVPHVKATAPLVETVAMYRSLGRSSYFQLKGIDLANEPRIGDLATHLFRPAEIDRILPHGDEQTPRPALEERVGEVLSPDRKPLSDSEIESLFSRKWRQELLARVNAGQPAEPRPAPGIVVGINLLLDRDVFLGDELTVITLSATGQTLLQNFLVVGAFKTGEFETDTRTAMVPIETLRSFLNLFTASGEPKSHGIRIALDDYRLAGEVGRAIIATLARDAAERWLPRLLENAERVVAGFDEENISSAAAEIQRRPGTPEVSTEEVVSAVREAVKVLEGPAQRLARPRVEAAFRAAVETAGRGNSDLVPEQPIPIFIEQEIVRGPIDALLLSWSESLAREGFQEMPAEKRALHFKAREQVFIDAQKAFHAANSKQLTDPLMARLRTWEERQRVLLQAVEREKGIVGFLVLLINMFIACLVLLMLVLLIIEKTRDLGVLLALGATTRGAVTIFLTTGLCLITVGTAFGLVAGYFFVKNLNPLHDAIYSTFGFKLFDPETYKIDRLPSTVSVTGVLQSTLPSILFGMVASLFPAIWASRQNPIKAIHYE